MNTNPPSVDQFLASSEPDDDDITEWLPGHGPLRQTPPDPMERVAEALERLADYHTKPLGEMVERLKPLYGDVHVHSSEAPHDWARKAAESAEALQLSYEKLADAEDQLKTMGDVISNVEAALGKSKAAPALAARAVIDAWRNPQVPPAEGDREPTPEESASLEAEALANGADPVTGADGHLPGHTRVEHDEQPGHFFCRDCTLAQQEWVGWPCPTVSGEAQPLATGPSDGAEQPVQPEHNAPVEEWREFARALGYAGPEIDKANRSMIRTTLGIAQVPAEGGA